MKKLVGLIMALIVFVGAVSIVGEAFAANKETKVTTKYPFTYKDANGDKVVLKKRPERIAVTYLPYWETLVALDYPPVAAVAAKNYSATWDPFKNYKTDSVVDLGDRDINLEKLIEVKPDLIIVPSGGEEGIENLRKIAPVIVMEQKARIDWRYGVREVGKIIGKSDVAEKKIAEIEKSLSAAKEKLQKKYKGQTVAIMSLMRKDGYFCARRPDFFDAKSGLGLTAPNGFTKKDNYEQVSLEAISKMNPDYLFVASFDGNEGLIEDLNKNSVWKSLKAVKNKHVYFLDGAAHSFSVLSTEYAVKAIVKDLLK